MTLHWLSASLHTGLRLASLPALTVDWPLRRSISGYDTATAHLQLSQAPPNWEEAVQEGGAVLACYDDADRDMAIQWAGYVVAQTRRATTDVVDLAVATLEAYLDRRDVGDVAYAAPDIDVDRSTMGRNQIIADMIENNVNTVVHEPGVPLRISYTDPGPVPDAPMIWQNTDNASVLTRLNQLVGQLGGEFTVEWAWSTDRSRLVPTLMIGDRIGTPVTPGKQPAVTFSMPGSLTDAQQIRDYSAGKGANKIVVFSSANNGVTPYAPAVYADDFDGRPTFEHRYSPAENISSNPTLQAYARQALAVLAPGARPVVLTYALAADQSRRLGVHWVMGDDIGYRLGGLDDNGKDLILAFPGGLSGVGRAIAYELTDSTVTPILADTQIYAGSGS